MASAAQFGPRELCLKLGGRLSESGPIGHSSEDLLAEYASDPAGDELMCFVASVMAGALTRRGQFVVIATSGDYGKPRSHCAERTFREIAFRRDLSVGRRRLAPASQSGAGALSEHRMIAKM
jgi:hypothetical protein